MDTKISLDDAELESLRRTLGTRDKRQTIAAVWKLGVKAARRHHPKGPPPKDDHAYPPMTAGQFKRWMRTLA